MDQLNEHVVSNSPTGLAAFRTDGQCVLVNETMAEIVGATKKQLLILNFRELDGWKRSGLLVDAEKTLSTGNGTERHVHFVTTFGKEVWIEYRFNRFKSDGQYHLLLTARNISARMLSEAALKSSETRYRALSEATFEAIFISEKGFCVDANHRAAEMFGYEPDELIGIFGTDVIAPQSKQLVKKNMLSGYEKPYTALGQRKDGTVFYTEIRGKMMAYKGKQVRVTVVSDIDQRKRAEMARLEVERKLRSREKELEIKNADLEQLNTALTVVIKRVEKEKRIIEGNVLMNLSNSIVPLLEKLTRTSRESEREKLVNVIQNEVEQITSGFKGILASSAYRLSPSEIRVCEMVRQGLTSKEIAGILNLSPKTISRHRDNIRKKLGICRSDINLRDYLSQITT